MSEKLLRRSWLALFILACLVFTCPQTAAAGSLLSFQAPDSNTRVQAVLYFRYLNSAYLSAETRTITVPHTESLEAALVKELILGPAGSTDLTQGLFPKDTQVLSVTSEGGRLFVTFNQQVEQPLERENTFSQAARAEAQLRRRLLTASLVNTLTENGVFRDVQILIFKDAGPQNSMRLSESFYLEDSSALPDPLTRQEERIITPGEALALILSRWEQQQWSNLMKLVATNPAENAPAMKLADFQQLPGLKIKHITPGSIAPTGDKAVVLLDAALHFKDGSTSTLTAFPVLLLRSHQGFLMSLSSLQAILEAR